MSPLFLAALVLLGGCNPTASSSDSTSISTCCAVDTASDGGSSDGGNSDGGGVAVPWDLVPLPVVSPNPVGITSPQRVFRAAGDDFIYVVNGDGSQVHILTQAYVQPEGDLCLDGVFGSKGCTGTEYTPGLISTSASPAVCLDDTDDQLLLVKSGGSRVELVATSHTGESWNNYHRVYAVRSISGSSDSVAFDGPCAARGGRLSMSSVDGIGLVDTSGETWSMSATLGISSGLLDQQWLGDSRWLLALSTQGDVWAIDTQTMTVGNNLAPAADATAMAVDPDRGVVWIAHGHDAQLTRVPFGDAGPGTPAEITTCGPVDQLSIDARTGAAYLLANCGDGASGRTLQIIDDVGTRLSQPLDEQPLALIPPGGMGHAAMLVQTSGGDSGSKLDGQIGLRAWLVHDPDDVRPPLSLFIISTLEEPFTASGMGCDSTTSGGPFNDYLDQLRSNIPVLAGMGYPVAIGVTWEFASKARECEALAAKSGGTKEDILQELSDAGFVLGIMIHDKPCYSCTNDTVEGEIPETCAPNDPDYAAANSAGACWPSDDNYCSRGDEQCWFDWTNAKQLELDGWLPGGAEFIFGADRHVLWDWEYIAGGYRVYDRADGGTGYDISMFQGDWIYPQITTAEDPRGKDPAPWTPERMGTTWFTASVDSYEQDSAFSDLLYMPGNSVTISRLHDWQTADIGLVQLFEEVNGMVTKQDDFDTLTGLLAQPVAHRTERPGTFYWHLADMTEFPLAPPKGDDRSNYADLIPAWAQQVDELYGSKGLGVVQWADPLQVQSEVGAWLAKP